MCAYQYGINALRKIESKWPFIQMVSPPRFLDNSESFIINHFIFLQRQIRRAEKESIWGLVF